MITPAPSLSRRLTAYFVRGLTTVLPAALTIWLLWWLVVTTESVSRTALLLVLPEESYVPGLGLLVGVALIVTIGWLTKAWLLRAIGHLVEELVDRTPIVKSVYGAIRDVLSLFGDGGREERMQGVVAVEVDGLRLIGLVTRDPAGELLGSAADTGADDDRLSAGEAEPAGEAASAGDDGADDDDDTLAVYLPMGYQIGGFMVLVPRSRVTPLDMTVEQGLRVALTAGVMKPSGRTSKGPARSKDSARPQDPVGRR